MTKYPIFLSLVCPIQNPTFHLHSELKAMGDYLDKLVEDYEIIIVDNASIMSSDIDTIQLLKKLTAKEGEPNLQVFTLTKDVSYETAAWVGLENSLGDFAIVFNFETDDLLILAEMVKLASHGKDVVFSRNTQRAAYPLFYSFIYKIYNSCLKNLAGIDLEKDVPSFRLLSKKVINYLLQFPNPSKQYRFLPATAGFSKETIEYSSPSRLKIHKSFKNSFEKGIGLLISTTKAPMRIVTALTIFDPPAPPSPT
jgi:hypothetical protein